MGINQSKIVKDNAIVLSTEKGLKRFYFDRSNENLYEAGKEERPYSLDDSGCKLNDKTSNENIVVNYCYKTTKPYNRGKCAVVNTECTDQVKISKRDGKTESFFTKKNKDDVEFYRIDGNPEAKGEFFVANPSKKKYLCKSKIRNDLKYLSKDTTKIELTDNEDCKEIDLCTPASKNAEDICAKINNITRDDIINSTTYNTSEIISDTIINSTIHNTSKIIRDGINDTTHSISNSSNALLNSNAGNNIVSTHEELLGVGILALLVAAFGVFKFFKKPSDATKIEQQHDIDLYDIISGRGDQDASIMGEENSELESRGV